LGRQKSSRIGTTKKSSGISTRRSRKVRLVREKVREKYDFDKISTRKVRFRQESFDKTTISTISTRLRLVREKVRDKYDFDKKIEKSTIMGHRRERAKKGIHLEWNGTQDNERSAQIYSSLNL